MRSGELWILRGNTIGVRDGAGHTLHARAGEVWITEENSRRDVVLRAGQSYRLVRPGLALVEAFRDAAIAVG
jgi:hypothetical protein